MALVLADRVQETSTTTGTGTLTLAGAVLGYQTFAAGIGSGNTCYYAITSTTGAWEVGIGTVGTGTLARTTLLSSSTGSLVSFTGTLNVFVTYPSEKSVNLDASNNLTVLNTTYLGGASGNQSLQVNNVASAVNYLQAVGAVTAGAPTISALGTDTNINAVIAAKGTGSVQLQSSGATVLNVSSSGAGVGDFINIYPTSGFMNWVLAGTDTNIGYVLTTKGGLGFYFSTGGGQQVAITHTASAVNYLNLTGAATGAAPTLSAAGSDTNIGLVLNGKGTGVVALGGSTVANSGLVVLPVSSVVNYLQVAGAATTGFVNVQAKGTDANVGLDLISKGSNPIRFYTQAQAAIQFRVADAASTVNYYQVTGGATGSGAVLQAIGSDANINAVITPKGTGGVQFTGPLLPNNTAGTSGQVLTSAGAGAVPTWAAPVSSNITANGLFENNATISANYTIGSGNNAVSAGPITINSGVVVTVPSSSTWVVV